MEAKEGSCNTLTTLSKNWSQASGSSQLTPNDKFMYKAIILHLRDIVQLKDITQCVTVAKTDKLKSSHGGWYYQSCHECPRVAKGQQPPYICGAGHNTDTDIYRSFFTNTFHLDLPYLTILCGHNKLA
ncbi:unnamed protein product [Lathyrus sativus]|nr:unnamed protein product [Lathyrus sativus]